MSFPDGGDSPSMRSEGCPDRPGRASRKEDESWDRIFDPAYRCAHAGYLLRTLSAEAYQPKQFEKNLTAREAERRIAALKAEIELANSF
jgi:hypothetical protein